MARILIIEDDGDLQQLLSIALNQLDYEVHYAFNGKEGYDKILQLQPDLVICDLMMPVLNGVEVIRLVTSNTSVKDIPIVVMTAHGDRSDMLESSIKAQGVRAYLRKPFQIPEFKSLVRRMLTQYPRAPVTSSQVAKGAVRLDVKFRTLWIDDRLVATLTPVKAALLRLLIESRGPVKREKLLTALWDDGKGGPAALEKAVSRLREDFGDEGRRIQTSPDGYELVG